MEDRQNPPRSQCFFSCRTGAKSADGADGQAAFLSQSKNAGVRLGFACTRLRRQALRSHCVTARQHLSRYGRHRQTQRKKRHGEMLILPLSCSRHRSSPASLSGPPRRSAGSGIGRGQAFSSVAASRETAPERARRGRSRSRWPDGRSMGWTCRSTDRRAATGAAASMAPRRKPQPWFCVREAKRACGFAQKPTSLCQKQGKRARSRGAPAVPCRRQAANGQAAWPQRRGCRGGGGGEGDGVAAPEVTACAVGLVSKPTPMIISFLPLSGGGKSY